MEVETVYDQADEQQRLAAVLFPRYQRMLVAWQELVASQFPELTPDEFRLDDAATRRQLAEAAERVVMIDRATQDAIRAQLQQGQERGYSNHELAYGVPEDEFRGIDGLFTVTWRARAETVARTELAHAQNRASLDRYTATGLVERVQIVENEDTDAPCADRNGKVVPIAEKPGLLHPNCRLGIIPIVEAPTMAAPEAPEAPPALPPPDPAEAVRQKVLRADDRHRSKVERLRQDMNTAVDAAVPVEERYWELAILPEGGVRPPEVEAERQRVRAEYHRLSAEVERANTAYAKAAAAHANAVRRALYVPQPDRDRWLAAAVAARLGGRVIDDPVVPPAPADTVF